MIDLNSPIVIAHLFDGAKTVNNILAGNDSITAEDLKELKENLPSLQLRHLRIARRQCLQRRA